MRARRLCAWKETLRSPSFRRARQHGARRDGCVVAARRRPARDRRTARSRTSRAPTRRAVWAVWAVCATGEGPNPRQKGARKNGGRITQQRGQASVRAGDGKEKRKNERGKGRREKEEEEEGGKRTNGIFPLLPRMVCTDAEPPPRLVGCTRQREGSRAPMLPLRARARAGAPPFATHCRGCGQRSSSK